MIVSEIEVFLREDTGDFDVFHSSLPDEIIRARIIAKEGGILAGLEEVVRIFSHCGISSSHKCVDGDEIAGRDIIIDLEGSSRAILQNERVALNILGRMSGIATLTRACVDMVKHTGTRIACTRKTTPGFRRFEKKAVMLGGGDPHRFNLTDAIMIKDNHIRIYGMDGAYKVAKDVGFMKKIEIEVENAGDAVHAAELGADVIMFDNMDAGSITEVISVLDEKKLRDSVILESSGGISVDNLVEYAETGVDVISLGMITHSARWLDFSLNVR
ncbi:MAG: carboxylating nicotinate-nucleotide diphosphorylase [Methanosarcinales archaeon]|jgi:nicotinate-nucleotide pyrophosphorylase (carboxylating)|nr:carboxylating nicotinate-nucleotide diphosphorylase [Methanosarcinales archaeon]MCK4810847.1 carboxylating nicotinate-nucleotide diphosphorylase [Methanosarcinales archaeon]